MKFLTDAFASEHGTRGKSFWDQLTGLPHQNSLLHDQIINSRRGMRLDKTIHQSFGHPVMDTTKPGFQVTCPEDFEPEDQRMAELEQLFDQWNDPSLTTAQRMRSGATLPPGFALLVRKGENEQPCQIIFISNPVLTKPDVTEPNTFGAPAPFGNIVNNEFAQKYVSDPSVRTHCLLGSMSGNTFASGAPGNRLEFEKDLLPVLMTDGAAIWNKPFNRDDWKILFFPTMSACPVGFVWPTSDGFESFQASITNRKKVFSGLLHLLKSREHIIKNWFNAVKASPASFAVPVVDALPFWSCFPTAQEPIDDRVLDAALLAPFQEQKDRFLRGHLMQLIYRSSSLPTSTLGFKMRARIKMHNMRVADSYPVALGITLPPECQAFVNYLFPFEDADKGWDGRIPKWFQLLDLDPATEVPDTYRQYTPRPLPSSAQDPEEYVTQRLTLPATEPVAAVPPMDDDLAEFLQATKRRRTSSGLSPVPPQVAPAPENSFVLTADGNFADGHGTNYVPQADPTSRQSRVDGLDMPAVTPSPEAYRPLNRVAPGNGPFTGHRDQPQDSSGFGNPAGGNPFAGVMNGTHIPLQSPAQGMPTDGIQDSTWNSPFPQGPRVQFEPHIRVSSPFPGYGPTTTSPAMGLPTPVHHQQMFSASPGMPPSHMYPSSHPDLSYQAGYGGMMHPMGHYQTHPAFHTNKPNSRSKYAPVRTASVNSDLERSCCPPELKAIGYWLVHPLPPNVGVVRTSLGDRAASDVLQFGLPTVIGRRCLEGFDYKNDGQVAVNIVCTAIEYRTKHQFGSFSQVGALQRDLRSVMNSEFVKNSYNIATWGVDPDIAPPPGTSKRFSLLAFLPCISESFSSDYLPRDGLAWQQMKEFAMVTYYHFALLGCTNPTSDNGDYDDSLFRNSLFGHCLRYICQCVQNTNLGRRWNQARAECTAAYFRDLSELFHLLKKFVDHRIGHDVENYGIGDAWPTNDRNAVFMSVPSRTNSAGFMAHSESVVSVLQEYYTRMQRTWGAGRYTAPNECSWAMSSSPFFAPGKPAQFKNPDVQKLKTTDRARDDKENVPFKNTSPLFVWNHAANPLGRKSPSEKLYPVVQRGTYPSIVDPKAARIPGKPNLFPICLNSSFEGHCTCSKPGTCKTQKVGRHAGKTRLHIDLNEARWSAATYKEEDWRPIVDFIKKYNTHILPSEAFKKLTPSTTW